MQVHKRSQEAVEQKWKYSPNVVCPAATVHGKMEKRATGSAMTTIKLNEGDAQTFGNAGVPIYDGIQVFISERFHFIYIRQPKSTSSSILAAIEKVYCGGRVCAAHEFTRMKTMVSDDIWRDYFVFTAVRNPFARMISAYNMFKLFLRKLQGSLQEDPGPRCGLPFTDFTEDVFRLRTICDTDQCCSFIKAGLNKFAINFPNAHITQQAHCIFTTGGDSIVDYIARSEHIDQDWEEIMGIIAQRSGKEVTHVPIENVNGHHQNVDLAPEEQHPCLEPDVVKLNLLNETTMFAIAKQFAMDIELLGFPIGGDQQDS